MVIASDWYTEGVVGDSDFFFVPCSRHSEYPSFLKEDIILLQSKYSVRSAYYLGMTFINRKRTALLESN